MMTYVTYMYFGILYITKVVCTRKPAYNKHELAAPLLYHGDANAVSSDRIVIYWQYDS